MSDSPAVPEKGTVATVSDDEPIVGMEDFDDSDIVTPKITIVQDEGVFRDSLSGEKFPALENIVILGLVNQRILWDAEVTADKQLPLCKAPDAKKGYPNPKTFPWKDSGFVAADHDEDFPIVTCADCALKEWGSHPKNDTPYCAEQKTLSILVPLPGGGYGPAILTLQRAAIKAVNAYFTTFKRSRTPSFTATTTITLTLQQRGTVKFSTPTFVRTGDTEDRFWPEWADSYRDLRDFLTRPPRNPAEVVESAAPAAAGDAPLDDDEVPF